MCLEFPGKFSAENKASLFPSFLVTVTLLPATRSFVDGRQQDSLLRGLEQQRISISGQADFLKNMFNFEFAFLGMF